MNDNYPSEGERAIAADETTEGTAETAVRPSAAFLRARAAEMLEEAGQVERAEARALLLAREAAKPKMPELGEAGAIVTFSRYQSGRDYHYAALGFKAGARVVWVVTGSETGRFNWAGLLEFIGEANWPSLHQVTGLTRIGPEPGAEAPVREVMGRFGRVERTETVGRGGVGGDPFHGAGGGGYLGGVLVVGPGGGGQRGPFASGGYVSHHTSQEPDRW